MPSIWGEKTRERTSEKEGTNSKGLEGKRGCYIGGIARWPTLLGGKRNEMKTERNIHQYVLEGFEKYFVFHSECEEKH